MKCISTYKRSTEVSFLEAMRQGLAPDGGLYMPVSFPVLPDSIWESIGALSFREVAFEMSRLFLKDELSAGQIQSVVEEAFDFPLELNEVESGRFVMELFHGPTLAFKDFGARFMARLFAEQSHKSGKMVTILVATSGDTGSAVASGFYNVDGVRVCLLYPKGKVSTLQEKQMTTLGGNITALEVDGVFDDCQQMVKEAFTDADLSSRMTLSSANSINIARLLPQSYYYAWAAGRLYKRYREFPVISVPSGNFGNLTGALFAQKLGMKTRHFIAATNSNKVVPEFLSGKKFQPVPSISTISNAMDVGNPSNFDRMRHLFGGNDDLMRRTIAGYSFSDRDTRNTIRNVFEKTGYVLDPHTAVGYRAATRFFEDEVHSSAVPALIAGTAHPVKFKEIVSEEIGREIDIPEPLRQSLQKEKKSIGIDNRYDSLKEFLTSG